MYQQVATFVMVALPASLFAREYPHVKDSISKEVFEAGCPTLAQASLVFPFHFSVASLLTARTMAWVISSVASRGIPVESVCDCCLLRCPPGC